VKTDHLAGVPRRTRTRDRCEKVLARWRQSHCSLWRCFELLNFGLQTE